MTALLITLDQDVATVVMDTLTSRDSEGRPQPHGFSTKFAALPHIRTVVCGTGAQFLVRAWADQVNHDCLVEGIENLDYHTPAGWRTSGTCWMKRSVAQRRSTNSASVR
jgi:hypothetical protein